MSRHALAVLVALITLAPSVLARESAPGSAQTEAEEHARAAAAEGTPFEREDVRAVAERIVCYCGCPHLQVSKCFCGTADDIRDDIARQLDAGQTPDEVIAAYIAEHGTYGLAVPPRAGFNWIIWVGPFVLLGLGVLLVILLGRRWKTPAGEPAPAGPMSVLDPEEEARVRAELKRSLRALD